ncbi:hypothetical protein SAMN02910453_1397 [Lachnospiraceae bacterium A10]|nr:hypothetical protein SAMN02910453_1397 [Lachnospiraceae bacterium A10]
MSRIVYPYLKIYLLCGLLGMVVYFFCRDSLLLSSVERNFEWFRRIREACHVEIIGPTAYFVKFLFGDALFAFANGRAVGLGHNNKKLACLYASGVSCSIELLQGLKVIYGVFDFGDVVVSIVFAILGVLVSEMIERIKIRKAYIEITEKRK